MTVGGPAQSMCVAAWAPEPGTPVAFVSHPLMQNLDAVTLGLTRSVGVNVEVAQMIADATGDRICWPFATVGFVDSDCNSIAFVIHGTSVADGQVEVSVIERGLTWSRPILRFLQDGVFIESAATELIMRVPAWDAARRRTLDRYGFRCVRRERDAGSSDRLTYSLHSTDIPPAFRRARLRRSH